MKWTSILAIYILFWVLSCFLVMPIGIRAYSDEGESAARVAGQADSAPINFNPRRIALRAAVVAAVLFGIYYVNYTQGWITTRTVAALLPSPDRK